MTLVLFDIDGTLLHSRGCGSAATRFAMQEVFGTMGALADFPFGGKTDWQMLLETLDGLVSPGEIQARLEEYDQILAHYLAAIISDYDVQPCRGAMELAHKCAAAPDIISAILTANMPRAAWIKLRQAGYGSDLFAFGVFGSEAPRRAALSTIALERANHLNHRLYSGEQAVIIGDTPDDITCARAIGAKVIAVATGRYGLSQLEAYKPDLALENLANVEEVFAFIHPCASG